MNHSFTGRPWLLYGLLTTSLSLNLYMVTHRAPAAVSPLHSVDAAQSASDAISIGPVTGTMRVPVEVVQPAQNGAKEVRIPIQRDVISSDPDWNILDEEVTHSLARTFARADTEKGAQISAAYARLFHWDIDLRRDLRKGDQVRVAWKETDQGIEIAAASFKSGKLGKTLKAYRFQRRGDAYSSYWQETGTEITRRLEVDPVADYEMITALLRDRPGHHGMDFKVDVGTSILATRAGTVKRTNWNTRSNGNCVEVQFSDGTLAKYLHLSKTGVKPGQKVKLGQVLGESGNTGHSTAPHLHYQLNKGKRVLDPTDVHGVTARAIHTGERDAFNSNVARLDALLGNALARR
jgi:murein DD-endopeptidase